jgi:two-component system, NarL family, response regulator LiaR
MTKQAKIHVMLVDDHAVVRSGLATFLEMYDDFELVAQAADGEEALRLLERVQPDVILMDLMMPRMDGPTTTDKIRERYPQIQILVLTSFKENQLIEEALRAGAIGYLLKNVGAEELADAVRAVYHGRPVLAPEAARALINVTTQRRTPALGADLTERERGILELLGKGLDNQQIADALVVSQSTVKFHVSNILSKLHAASRTEAVIIALEHNLVSKPKKSAGE